MERESQFLFGGELIWRGRIEVNGQSQNVQISLADYLRLDEVRDAEAIDAIGSALVQALAQEQSEELSRPVRSFQALKLGAI